METGTVLIPYGAGSSVVGHINPAAGDRPVLVSDLGKLNHLVSLDPISRIAVVEAGILGPDLEAVLQPHGFTFGHFPQSFEFSSLGGWIATRSSGQQSYYYGRIEDQFLGGEVETFPGKISISPYPASAAGPDIKHLILGSEGRIGIITRAAIRIHPIPESEAFKAIFFRDWDTGAEVVRRIAQNRIPVSMLRLSDEIETQTTLLLSGKDRIVRYAERGLNAAGYKGQRCLLIFGATGSSNTVNQTVRRVYEIGLRHRGLPVPFMIGRLWQKTRFFTPYLRNTLWECGYALDTLETVLPWEKVIRVAREVRSILEHGLEEQHERVLAFAHLSHVYQVGASFYITYIFRRSPDPELTLAHWITLKSAASHAILAEGGTISHQHGVGMDHSPYLTQERGAPFVHALRSALLTFDPQGLLNPGKLIAATDKEVCDVETRMA